VLIKRIMDGGATLAVLETKTGGGRREWDGPQSELTASLRRIHVLTIAFPPGPLMATYRDWRYSKALCAAACCSSNLAIRLAMVPATRAPTYFRVRTEAATEIPRGFSAGHVRTLCVLVELGTFIRLPESVTVSNGQ
jgi:hypothetical protein